MGLVQLSASTNQTFSPQVVGAGFASYYASPGIYTWNATTGERKLRVETPPTRAFLTTNWLYFQSGVGIYRVPLD